MKKPVLTLLLASVASPSWSAESSTAAIDALLACSVNPDMSSRLACFDREIAPLAAARTRSAASPAPPVAPPPPLQRQPKVTPPPTDSASSFGAENLSTPQSALKSQVLHAHISELKSAGTGRFLVTLDNGQIWRHEDAYLGGYLKEGEAVTLSKGALGAYRLTRDEGQSKNWIRVTRVR
jgi:hypothetical protein